MLEMLVLATAGAAWQPQDVADPQSSALIEYENPEPWRFEAVFAVSDGLVFRNNSNEAYVHEGSRPIWELQSYTLAMPLVQKTAAAVMAGEPLEIRHLVNVADADWKWQSNQSPQGGPTHRAASLGGHASNYMVWDGPEGKYARMVVGYRADVTCFETLFDEDKANQVGWPGTWPGIAMQALQPEPYVSSQANGAPFEDGTLVAQLLEKWTGGEDPQAIAPVQLAKWLAGNVQQFVNIREDGLMLERDLRARGFQVRRSVAVNVRDAEQVILDPTGSGHDATVLLTALYREAGLPARMVIGYQETEGSRRQKVGDMETIRSWVEFALVDSTTNALVWIPVDVHRMREKSRRMGDLSRPWEYFGTHDELDRVVPFSHHFTPPQESELTGPPGFIGFAGQPDTPERFLFHFEFEISSVPVGPGN